MKKIIIVGLILSVTFALFGQSFNDPAAARFYQYEYRLNRGSPLENQSENQDTSTYITVTIGEAIELSEKIEKYVYIAAELSKIIKGIILKPKKKEIFDYIEKRYTSIPVASENVLTKKRLEESGVLYTGGIKVSVYNGTRTETKERRELYEKIRIAEGIIDATDEFFIEIKDYIKELENIQKILKEYRTLNQYMKSKHKK